MKLTVFFLLSYCCALMAQDTFSVVAADSTTREVGSAGASCVDLFQAGFTDASFLGDLLPDTGAINTQAFYLESNQDNARARMRLGESPVDIINWLVKHDAGDNPSIRQYGIAGFTGNEVSSAGFTGNQNIDYKNHRTGQINGIHYSIQGNILLGSQIIDSMEARFRNANGDLACRLMAALQGANTVGADTRCTSDGTSSLFAFLKVAQPDDRYGNPSFIVTVKTHDNSHIEPVDSLQSLFDAQHSCSLTGLDQEYKGAHYNIFPNPVSNTMELEVDPELIGSKYHIFDRSGKSITEGIVSGIKTALKLDNKSPGLYFFQLKDFPARRFIIQ